MTVAGSVAEGTADGAGTMASFRSPMAVEYDSSSRTIVVAGESRAVSKSP